MKKEEYGTADGPRIRSGAGSRWTQIAPTALEVVHDAADFETGVAEIQQQCQLQASGLQIFHALRGVDAVEGSHCFQFNDDVVINQEIRGVLTNEDAVIPNDDRMLLRNSRAILAKFVRQAIFVDLFQESGTHGVQDREGAADDPLGNPVQCNFICVHLLPAPDLIRGPSAVPFPFLIGPTDWLRPGL